MPTPVRGSSSAAHMPRHRSAYLGFYLTLFIPALGLLHWWLTRGDPEWQPSLSWVLLSFLVIPVALWGARVDAWTDDEGIHIVDLLHRHDVPWGQVGDVYFHLVSRPDRWFSLAPTTYQAWVVPRDGQEIRPRSWANLSTRQVAALTSVVEERTELRLDRGWKDESEATHPVWHALALRLRAMAMGTPGAASKQSGGASAARTQSASKKEHSVWWSLLISPTLALILWLTADDLDQAVRVKVELLMRVGLVFWVALVFEAVRPLLGGKGARHHPPGGAAPSV